MHISFVKTDSTLNSSINENREVCAKVHWFNFHISFLFLQN